jgi:hypothetical protein
MDLMQQSGLFRAHVSAGKIIFGVNHEMRDFATGRKKDLDLVVARPATAVSPNARTLADLAANYGVVLDAAQQQRFDALPAIREGKVSGAVLIALEAKAAMTAHSKARPRLYDELNSSHLTIHGASRQALAVGFVMVNISTTFISPDLNKKPGAPIEVSTHRQPQAAQGVIEKVEEIPRRSSNRDNGFDGLAIVVVRCANDGSPVTVVTSSPAPPPGDVHNYQSMVSRIANEYDTTFATI